MNQSERVKRFFDQRKHAEDGTWAPPPGVLDPTIRSGDADLLPVKASGTDSQEIVWNPPVAPPRARRRRYSLDLLSQLFVQPLLWCVFYMTVMALVQSSGWSLRARVLLTFFMMASISTSFLLFVLSVIDYQSSLRDKEDDENERLERMSRQNN